MTENLAYKSFINDLLAEPARVFLPFAEYNRDGDCIEFFLDPEPHYAERIDGLLTVYRSQQTNDIVGAQIKRVSQILKKFPGLQVEVHDGKISLVSIIRVSLWSLPRKHGQEVVHIYKILTDKAEGFSAEMEDEIFGVSA